MSRNAVGIVDRLAPPMCDSCIRAGRCLIARTRTAWPGDIDVRRVRAGQTLLRQGEPVTHVLVVQVGLVTLRRQGDGTAMRTIAIVGPGQALGVRTLTGHAPAAVDATALTDARVCQRPVSRDGVPPAVLSASLDECTRLAETLSDWAAIGRLPTASERVEAVLRRLAQCTGSVEVPLPERALLAELAACAPETVSRAVGMLVRQGRLRRGGPRRVQLTAAAPVTARTPPP
jgi:CRP-like cAMP-binding protein